MNKKPRVSIFVRLIMPEAGEAEIEDATNRWFAFLEIINRMVERRSHEGGDSRPIDVGDRFKVTREL